LARSRSRKDGEQRRARLTSRIKAALNALKRSGVEAHIRVQPDGAIDIVPGKPLEASAGSEVNEWDEVFNGAHQTKVRQRLR
jgi:hypothetical protein